MPSVRFAGVLRPATVAAHLSWLVRRPRDVSLRSGRGGARRGPLLSAGGGKGDSSCSSRRGRWRAGGVRDGRGPRSRALRQPSGHRGVDRAPAHRHPLQLHGPRQRPLRGPRAARPQGRRRAIRDRDLRVQPPGPAGALSLRRACRGGPLRRRHRPPRLARDPGARDRNRVVRAWRASCPRRATCTSWTRSPCWPSAGPASGSSSWATVPSAERIVQRARELGVADARVPAGSEVPRMSVRALLGRGRSLRAALGAASRAGGWRASRWR